jgi:hypothetical protein
MFCLLQNKRTGGQNRFCGGCDWHQRERGSAGKRGRRMNMVKQCLHMYVNAKMIPVETVPGIRKGWARAVVWEEFKYDIFDTL